MATGQIQIFMNWPILFGSSINIGTCGGGLTAISTSALFIKIVHKVEERDKKCQKNCPHGLWMPPFPVFLS